jgi:hypothetical protein
MVAAAVRDRMVRMSSKERLLERPAVAFTEHGDQAARDHNKPAYSATASASGPGGHLDWGGLQVREWLLLLLRFAVTFDAKDQLAALALADEVDARGLQWRPTFFRRTTKEVCKAIHTLDDPKRAAILKRHLGRIDNPVLKRAFRAAVNIDERTAFSEHKARNLWFGLPR